jgi:hypothetical protein
MTTGDLIDLEDELWDRHSEVAEVVSCSVIGNDVIMSRLGFAQAFEAILRLAADRPEMVPSTPEDTRKLAEAWKAACLREGVSVVHGEGPSVKLVNSRAEIAETRLNTEPLRWRDGSKEPPDPKTNPFILVRREYWSTQYGLLSVPVLATSVRLPPRGFSSELEHIWVEESTGVKVDTTYWIRGIALPKAT